MDFRGHSITAAEKPVKTGMPTGAGDGRIGEGGGGGGGGGVGRFQPTTRFTCDREFLCDREDRVREKR